MTAASEQDAAALVHELLDAGWVERRGDVARWADALEAFATSRGRRVDPIDWLLPTESLWDAILAERGVALPPEVDETERRDRALRTLHPEQTVLRLRLSARRPPDSAAQLARLRSHLPRTAAVLCLGPGEPRPPHASTPPLLAALLGASAAPVALEELGRRLDRWIARLRTFLPDPEVEAPLREARELAASLVDALEAALPTGDILCERGGGGPAFRLHGDVLDGRPTAGPPSELAHALRSTVRDDVARHLLGRAERLEYGTALRAARTWLADATPTRDGWWGVAVEAWFLGHGGGATARRAPAALELLARCETLPAGADAAVAAAMDELTRLDATLRDATFHARWSARVEALCPDPQAGAARAWARGMWALRHASPRESETWAQAARERAVEDVDRVVSARARAVAAEARLAAAAHATSLHETLAALDELEALGDLRCFVESALRVAARAWGAGAARSATHVLRRVHAHLTSDVPAELRIAAWTALAAMEDAWNADEDETRALHRQARALARESASTFWRRRVHEQFELHRRVFSETPPDDDGEPPESDDGSDALVAALLGWRPNAQGPPPIDARSEARARLDAFAARHRAGGPVEVDDLLPLLTPVPATERFARPWCAAWQHSAHLRLRTRALLNRVDPGMVRAAQERLARAPRGAFVVLGRARELRRDDGQWVDLRRTPILADLLHLLTTAHLRERGRGCDPEMLIGRAWGGAGGDWEAATNRLHQAVSRLRRAGCDGLVVSHAGGYGIRPDADVVRVLVP